MYKEHGKKTEHTKEAEMKGLQKEQVCHCSLLIAEAVAEPDRFDCS